ncbi:MAG: hypothetical protein M3430_05250 [Acidobacteriota bacterium]|nr:hypothetical protein [Acidobacteriota bacterium]
MIRKTFIIAIALCLTVLAQAQEPRPQPREVWNDVFSVRLIAVKEPVVNAAR